MFADASTHNVLVTKVVDALPYVLSLGTGLGALMLTLVTGMYKFIKSQVTNGDGRTLRKALDDLALDFADHRHETRTHLTELKERVEETGKRLATVEQNLRTHTI